MPTLSVSSSASLPATTALPSVTIRHHGLYLATMIAFFRTTKVVKTARPAAVPAPVRRPRASAAALHLTEAGGR